MFHFSKLQVDQATLQEGGRQGGREREREIIWKKKEEKKQGERKKEGLVKRKHFETICKMIPLATEGNKKFPLMP